MNTDPCILVIPKTQAAGAEVARAGRSGAEHIWPWRGPGAHWPLWSDGWPVVLPNFGIDYDRYTLIFTIFGEGAH